MLQTYEPTLRYMTAEIIHSTVMFALDLSKRAVLRTTADFTGVTSNMKSNVMLRPGFQTLHWCWCKHLPEETTRNTRRKKMDNTDLDFYYRPGHGDFAGTYRKTQFVLYAIKLQCSGTRQKWHCINLLAPELFFLLNLSTPCI